MTWAKMDTDNIIISMIIIISIIISIISIIIIISIIFIVYYNNSPGPRPMGVLDPQ